MEHWNTLEIWVWSLAHPDRHWSQREDPEEPSTYADVVSGIAALGQALAASLRAHGPDVAVDYFERPGRASDVARLLAHESIVVAHKAGAGLPLTPDVARDGIDQLLSHWGSSAVGNAAGTDGMPATTWQSEVLAIRATDGGNGRTPDLDATWLISLPHDAELRIGDFRVESWPDDGPRNQTPTATVQGPAVDLLWWLQGDPIPEAVVSVTGNDADVRALKQTFLQPVPEPRRRWFGLRSGQ